MEPNLTISQLFIYPVKSLGGIVLNEAVITDRGLMHDRRWMLIDDENGFLSQRRHPNMALFNLVAGHNGLKVTYQPDGTSAFIPYAVPESTPLQVRVWGDVCSAVPVDAALDEWFSAKLDFSCRLVYMPDASQRPVDERYAVQKQEVVSFADAYPFLLMGQSSLDDLNSRLQQPVAVNRFRPNIMFTGAGPFFEDQMAQFNINNIQFFGVKPCARCVMIGVDQATAQTSQEPMRTLAAYRTKNKKVYLGQNLLHQGQGVIRVGDSLHIQQLSPEFIPQLARLEE